MRRALTRLIVHARSPGSMSRFSGLGATGSRGLLKHTILRGLPKRYLPEEEFYPVWDWELFEPVEPDKFYNWKSKYPDGLPEQYEIINTRDQNMFMVKDEGPSFMSILVHWLCVAAGFGVIYFLCYLWDPEKRNRPYSRDYINLTFPYDGLYLELGGDPAEDPKEIEDVRNNDCKIITKKAIDKAFEVGDTKRMNLLVRRSSP